MLSSTSIHIEAVGQLSRPQNCMDWYTAFAFCAWDGGRLATEAEWNCAASGDGEQRYFPWSNPSTSTVIDDNYAVYCGGSCNGTQNVGSKATKGDGRWGQADLGPVTCPVPDSVPATAPDSEFQTQGSMVGASSRMKVTKNF
ncbi:MAG TPA: SUMF1/EgtB/PvdO family nonheme iron enzyme [Polyangia bacterium]|nr:SUMF1/EgtB/PvdO family nonheme iron enzyme [Polyangia bacterium]